MLQLGQAGASSGCIESFLASISFLYKFYLVREAVIDPTVHDIKTFLSKVCPRHTNRKCAFGSAQIRTMWDALEAKRGGIEFLSALELRTFVMAVFQHATFCRYSDVANLKLSDLCYDLDYFKVTINLVNNYLTRNSNLAKR